MTAVLREQVAAALFALVAAAVLPIPVAGQTAWVTSSRRLRLWDDVDPGQQPAVFLVEHEEHDTIQGRGIPRTGRMNFSVFAYARTDDPTIVGGTLVNSMLSAIETAILPSGSDFTENAQTLGGLVNWCRIEGRIFKDPGDIDNQAMVIVPIVVLMP